MGRQWLLAHREANASKKAASTTRYSREISLAAKAGGADIDLNPRLAMAVERAKKNSVSKDVIERAIKKGAGLGDDKMVVEHVVYEGYAPHKVPVIVECYTDNINRTGPEIRVLFRKGQLGASGSNKFLFEHNGIIEAWHADNTLDGEEAAIEAGANEIEIMDNRENDEIPEQALAVRFLCDPSAIHSTSGWLKQNDWNILTAEPGYIAKSYPELEQSQREEVAAFLQSLEEHDDVHRVWVAFK